MDLKKLSLAVLIGAASICTLTSSSLEAKSFFGLSFDFGSFFTPVSEVVYVEPVPVVSPPPPVYYYSPAPVVYPLPPQPVYYSAPAAAYPQSSVHFNYYKQSNSHHHKRYNHHSREKHSHHRNHH